MLKKITLADFRNFTRAEFDFFHTDIVLTGANGSGKSNLLEAVNHLSILRSFRGSGMLREEVRIGCTSFTISGILRTKSNVDEKLTVSESLNGSRKLLIGDCVLKKSSDFIGEFSCVPFVPEDVGIVSGTSGLRRRFFDMLISPLDREYFFALCAYSRALDQRNAALKSGSIAAAAAFENELAENALKIADKRFGFSGLIKERVNRFFNGRYDFDCRYICTFPQEKEEYLARLKENREKELIRRHTMTGPQLDDFEFRLNGNLLRGYSSAGQQRISALMLRLSQFSLLKELSVNPVIALVDDVTGELDENNFNHFVSSISGADQRIFTFTEVPECGNFRNMQIIDISEVKK